MEWLEIDVENLPKGEVLAANFKPRTYGYKEKILGYMHIEIGKGSVTCENDSEQLENCTHYIDINKWDI